jgi:hypothetical protein
MPTVIRRRKYQKTKAKVGWLQKIPLIFEIKVLSLIVQKQKNNETAYTKNTGKELSIYYGTS